VVIILTTSIAAGTIFTLQCTLAEFIKNHPSWNSNDKKKKGYFASLASLAMFLLECSGNILVQLTSSLAATLAITVFASARSIIWGFAGAFSSITLLWILKQSLSKH